MVDLHCHSSCSDGTDAPEALARIAAEKGLSAVVLTDHDTDAGSDRFIAAAAALGVRSVRGMELSADVPEHTVHLLAYGFDPANSALSDAVRQVREGRTVRNEKILEKLKEHGFPVTMEEVRAEAEGAAVIARPHIARVLVKKRFARDRIDAFDRFLSKGGIAYTERFRLSPETCIELVRAAGGVVSLAHPMQTRFNRSRMRKFVKRLAEVGLGGIEVHYPGHLPGIFHEYSELAREFNLVTTGGSDYHGANHPGVSLGTAYGSLAVPDSCFDALCARIGA